MRDMRIFPRNVTKHLLYPNDVDRGSSCHRIWYHQILEGNLLILL